LLRSKFLQEIQGLKIVQVGVCVIEFGKSSIWHPHPKYCIPTCFQTRVCVSKQESLMYKNGCFCYMYTESLFFILFDGFSLINSLGKSISMISSEKMQSYDVTITVFDIKGGNFNFFYFSSNFNAVFFAKWSSARRHCVQNSEGSVN
jgi:hypothetical protein